MWSFQGQRPASMPAEDHDSFAEALTKLDDIPLAYQQGHRASRISMSETECGTPDDSASTGSVHFGSHPAVGWNRRASGSTLKDLGGPFAVISAEEGTVQPPAPPKVVGFWDRSLQTVRQRVFKKYALILSILCLFVLSVLSIYWGVLFRVKENLQHVTVAVVDFDGRLPPYQSVDPLIGPFIVARARAELSRTDAIGFRIHDPSEYDNDPLAVRLAVHQEKLWGAIIVNANATSLLRSAVTAGNASYDPLGAAQIIYNQARDIESYNQYITPILQRFVAEVPSLFGRQWTSSVLTNATYDPAIYSSAPQALSPAIGFSIYNLRPFDPPVAIPAVSIGLIYLIIIAFFSFSFFVPTHLTFLTSSATTGTVLSFPQLILWRYLANLFTYFSLSLCYSLISLFFLIPFTHRPPNGQSTWPKTDVANNANPFGHGTWPLYWCLNFIGMTALGLACENVAMVIGPPWTALWLIFWVITNVATGFYALELAPKFYRWGYVWPLRQIVYASRTLLFGTNSRLAYNFGILIMWVGVGSLLFPACCYFMRWKGMREKRKAEEAAKRASRIAASRDMREKRKAEDTANRASRIAASR